MCIYIYMYYIMNALGAAPSPAWALAAVCQLTYYY